MLAEMEKAADMADKSVLFFSAGANFWAPELPVLTSSNGINTSAIGIERNAVFCYFQIFHGRFGDLCCFVVTPIRRNLCFLCSLKTLSGIM